MKHIFQASREFAARYFAAFKAVWSIRAQLDPPVRTADELAFLPAQLELVETPVSPAPRWAMRLIIAMFATALLWAFLGHLDIVAVSQGKIIPGGRTKAVQPLEPGVVTAIHVRDGQHVAAGELLIELDSVATAADALKANEALTAAQGSEARYTAELAALDKGAIALDPFTFALGDAAEIDTQNRLARSEYAAYIARRDALSSQLTQREAELTTLRGLIVHLQKTAEVTRARAGDLEALLAKDFVSRHEYLAAEQARIESERDLAQSESRIFELEAAIVTQRKERDGIAQEFRRQLTEGLRQSAEQVLQFTQDTQKSDRRNQLTRLTAPVSGTVQQLAVHTIGGVVTPAQPLMAIVPDEDALEVEALVLNRDIGFVRKGQDVVMKVESFPYTRYGYLTGHVLSVSHDAIQHEQLGLVFQARVQLDQRSLDIDGTQVRLSPGMNLTVEVKTGTRRVIDYLLSPLRKSSEESMRER